MNPLIKWPGGKAKEIGTIMPYIPDYDRYIEPFFGGGALFFGLQPEKAVINDISAPLIQYYRLIKKQDKQLHRYLLCYCNSFNNLVNVCTERSSKLIDIFSDLKNSGSQEFNLKEVLNTFLMTISDDIFSGFDEDLLLDNDCFLASLLNNAVDKYLRTIINENKKPFSKEDLCENLITGFTSGYYMYFRTIFNDISLGRIPYRSAQYQSANFYFIREYCYGSMFRYNTKGEFNIPYGGMSYNRKDMHTKIRNMFNPEVELLMSNTDIHCSDFENFLNNVELKKEDFIFLDPPYDTEFSNYDGKDFTKKDQERLASVLKNTPANFILVIKNTEFIHSLYKDSFNILCFNKRYLYNVKSRNNRDAEHLLITNLSI